MSKSIQKPEVFGRIKRVPSDVRNKRKESNDMIYDIRFNHIPANIQVPVYR